MFPNMLNQVNLMSVISNSTVIEILELEIGLYLSSPRNLCNIPDYIDGMAVYKYIAMYDLFLVDLIV